MNKYFMIISLGLVSVQFLNSMEKAESRAGQAVSKADQINEFVKTYFENPVKAQEIEQAQIIVFPESHDRLEHKQSVSKLINLLENKNAILLLEGYEKGQVITPEQLKKRHFEVHNIEAKGWDDLSDDEEFLAKLRETFQKATQALQKEGTLENVSLPTIDYQGSMIKRNKSMIAAIEEELKQGKKVYVSFGSDHLFSQKAGQELSDFLLSKKSIVLVPKDIEKKYSENIEKQLKYFGNKVALSYSQFSIENPDISASNLSAEEINNRLPILIKELNANSLLLKNSKISKTLNELMRSLSQSNMKFLILMKCDIDSEKTIQTIIDNSPSSLTSIRIISCKIEQQNTTDEELIEYAKKRKVALRMD